MPETVNYDLWCGPSAMRPIRRPQFHYHWHWFWETGNGEIGNNGAHTVDVARWFLGQHEPPPRTISVGGRFAFDDEAETANTQVILYDYRPVPLLCEVRNVKPPKAVEAKTSFHGLTSGLRIDCAGGYLVATMPGATFFDRQGKKIKEFRDPQKPEGIETAHAANFIAAVRSRKPADLHAEAREGFVSATCLHLANLSHRLGKPAAPEAIRAELRPTSRRCEAFPKRCRDYLERRRGRLRENSRRARPLHHLDAQGISPAPWRNRRPPCRGGRCRPGYEIPEIA